MPQQWSSIFRVLRHAAVLAFFSALIFSSAGCSDLANAFNDMTGTNVPAQYTGLANHSVAIVVYADDSVTFMYPQVRDEISSFISDQIQKNVPSARLLDYHLVTAYQDQTMNWESLPVKSIGNHFSVDRVLYVEVVAYTTHAAGSSDLLQGHIEANISVYNTQIPGDGQEFKTLVDVYSPTNGPAPSLNADENTVRMDALNEFSRDVVHNFYSWRNTDQNQQQDQENTGNDESGNFTNQ